MRHDPQSPGPADLCSQAEAQVAKATQGGKDSTLRLSRARAYLRSLRPSPGDQTKEKVMNIDDADKEMAEGFGAALALTEEATGCIATITAARVEHNTPSEYRLATKTDGTLVLQGAYMWQQGFEYGHKWRDIPTVEWKEKP